MSKFTTIEIGQIQESITRAVAKVAGKFPRLRQSLADIEQDAWCKVLAGYDRDRDAQHATERDAREIDRRSAADGMIYRDAKRYNDAKHKHAIGASPYTPAAFAYVVATTTALDAARGLVRKHDSDHVSFDAPVGRDEDSSTLADTLASALATADVSIGLAAREAAVAKVLATLSPAMVDALEAFLDDRTMTGGQRIAKKRAIELIQESISASL